MSSGGHARPADVGHGVLCATCCRADQHRPGMRYAGQESSVWIVRALGWLAMGVTGMVGLCMLVVAMLALLPLLIIVPPTLLIIGLAEAMADSD